jgi:hypothetical protein
MDSINITWMILGMVAGIGIGYAITIIRVNLFLRKYYPDVNFQTPSKERLEYLEKKRKEIKEQDEVERKKQHQAINPPTPPKHPGKEKIEAQRNENKEIENE